ncbi:1-acyl-sn-glycerol-3-phosphate acyltransferase [Amycolatopsis sp. 195334CR]|uniref:lysophospholipid acyltransferase family protein n=1 Tax=Amycolatopsis sp. 195334CR TaxID=2814588 RepID=UPI001A9092EC|nr:lysophospholipid acyltransferase family protein [Amycolatopsis sp. 195334CR]MBN6035945.1 1-acyl-sn-glycerol-3-phosphate acyltransferase [Amycolatopsis sp. 195334CR]
MILLRLLFRLVFRPVVRGHEHLPRTGPVILASNHLSFIDSVVLQLVTRRQVHFLAKAEYFQGTGLRGRVIRWFFTATGAVPVERGTHRAARGALETALGVLADGKVFGIYPEGTRSLDGRLYRGRTGVAWLALTAGVPVVPVALTGTDRLQPVGRKLPRPHRVGVTFGPPIHRSGPPKSGPARREVTDEVMHAIQRMSGQETAPEFNSSPVI